MYLSNYNSPNIQGILFLVEMKKLFETDIYFYYILGLHMQQLTAILLSRVICILLVSVPLLTPSG